MLNEGIKSNTKWPKVKSSKFAVLKLCDLVFAFILTPLSLSLTPNYRRQYYA